MTQLEVNKYIQEINKMSHIDMAHLWRFAPAGCIYFVDPVLYKFFTKRFQSFGGMTPEISKTIGW